MKDDSHDAGGPPQSGELSSLPREMQPPPELERKVMEELRRRGLIGTASQPRSRSGQPFAALARTGLAAAASLVLVAVGFLLGRATAPELPAPGAAQTQRPTLYALSLFETDGFQRAEGAGALERYQEYSRWVAEARSREQFVTGEDLTVDRGWLLAPMADAEPGVSPPASASLSGIFFITADDEQQALELARQLPHLQHGGYVVMQEVIPTDAPPRLQ